MLGSVKSMIGHAMPAAGIAGLVKAALAVSHGMLLPTLHCDTPRPELARTRFETTGTARPWPASGPRRAAVNAFGFGGINAHVIVEEAPAPSRPRHRPAAPAPGPAAAQVTEPDQVVLLAGPDQAAVSRLLDADDHAIRAHGTARAGQPAAGGGECRLGIADPTPARLGIARKIAAAGQAWRGGRDVWFSPEPLLAGGQGRIACLFPGLEAEFSPRVDDLAAQFGLPAPAPHPEGMAGHLAAVVQVGWLLHEALERIGIPPDALAGHSLGEWTAIVAAGLVDEEKLQQYAAAFAAAPQLERPDLLHAVVGDSAAAVSAQLGRYPGVVLTLDNAPAQSVVCGPVPQVNRLIADLSQQNTLCRPLPFTTGIHTHYLEPVVRQLREVAGEEIGGRAGARSARRPLWSATIAAPVPADPAGRQELFFRHLVEPVRFRATVQAMYEAGFRVFLQAGPGQLATLVHDNLRGRGHLAMPVNVDFRAGLDQLRRVLLALWVEGRAVDFTPLRPAAAASPAAATPEAAAAASPSPAAATPGSAASPGAAPAGRRTAPGPGRPVRLELGWARVKLGEGASDLLGLEPAAGPAGSMAVARLGQLAGRSPASAELAALLDDTAKAAVAVLSALDARPGPAGPPHPSPVPPGAPGGGNPGRTAGTPARPQAPVSPAAAAAPAEPATAARRSRHPSGSAWPACPTSGTIASSGSRTTGPTRRTGSRSCPPP